MFFLRAGLVNRKPTPYRISEDDVNKWRHYILEFTDYANTSVCRILVTSRVHQHLTPYDPTILGGPWYWDIVNDDHYSLQRVLRYDGVERALVTEFLRESGVVGLSVPGPDWSVIRDIGKCLKKIQVVKLLPLLITACLAPTLSLFDGKFEN